jgi:hypothetical protein
VVSWIGENAAIFERARTIHRAPTYHFSLRQANGIALIRVGLMWFSSAAGLAGARIGRDESTKRRLSHKWRVQ